MVISYKVLKNGKFTGIVESNLDFALKYWHGKGKEYTLQAIESESILFYNFWGKDTEK
jgi:hypothetical protein